MLASEELVVGLPVVSASCSEVSHNLRRRSQLFHVEVSYTEPIAGRPERRLG